MSKRAAMLSGANNNNNNNKRHHGCPTSEEEEDTANELFSFILDLTFAAGFFALEDLRCLMNASKAIAGPLRQCKGWKVHFLDDKIEEIPCVTGRTIIRRTSPLGLAPPVGRISEDYWHGPHIPCDSSTKELRVPPRPRARTQEQPDRRSYYPARTDEHARGFVLAKEITSWPPGLQRFNNETGALEDLFYPAREDPGPDWGIVTHRTKVYIPRPLPVVCHDCGATCTSYEDVVEHCLTLQHQTVTTPRDRRIPKEFWDPRDQPGFSNKTAFEQVKACMTYKHKIIDFLRSPMDEGSIRNMERQLEWIIDRAEMNEYSTENCTLECVTDACVDFVLGDFESEGMSLHGYCRDVIIGGWGNFALHGSGSAECLFSSIVEE